MMASGAVRMQKVTDTSNKVKVICLWTLSFSDFSPLLVPPPMDARFLAATPKAWMMITLKISRRARGKNEETEESNH